MATNDVTALTGEDQGTCDGSSKTSVKKRDDERSGVKYCTNLRDAIF